VGDKSSFVVVTNPTLIKRSSKYARKNRSAHTTTTTNKDDKIAKKGQKRRSKLPLIIDSKG